MKKLLITFYLIAVSLISFSQVKVDAGGNIIPTGPYPAVSSEHVKGGLHSVNTITERNAITNGFRKEGMIAYVANTKQYFKLEGGILNTNWVEFFSGVGIDSLYLKPNTDSVFYSLNQVEKFAFKVPSPTDYVSDIIEAPDSSYTRFVFKNGDYVDLEIETINGSGSGGGGTGDGDMKKAVYDPTGQNKDAFDYLNMANRPGYASPVTEGLVKVGKGLTINGAGELSTKTALLTPQSVPFVDANGEMAEDVTGLRYDGNNLQVGHSDFGSTTGLGLNGNRGYIGASGFGMTIKTTGGQPMDGSKTIQFYNSSTRYGYFGMRGATSNPLDSILRFTSQMEIVPYTTNKYNLGLLNKQWDTTFTKELYVNGVRYVPGSGGSVDLSNYYIKSEVDDFLVGKQNSLTLTTTGSGAATLVGNTLNIPTNTGGAGGVGTLEQVVNAGNVATKDIRISGLDIGNGGVTSTSNLFFGKLWNNTMFHKTSPGFGNVVLSAIQTAVQIPDISGLTVVGGATYPQGKMNTFIGWQSGGLTENASTMKTYSNTDVNINDSIIYLPSHGWGPVNRYGYCKVDTDFPNTWLQPMYKIVTVDSIKVYSSNLQRTNSSTNTIRAYNYLENSTGVGARSKPTKLNQVMLGNEDIQEVFTYGNMMSKIKQSAADPTTSDIPHGFTSIWKNITTGKVYLWVNNNGIMLKTELQ